MRTKLFSRATDRNRVRRRIRAALLMAHIIEERLMVEVAHRDVLVLPFARLIDLLRCAAR